MFQEIWELLLQKISHKKKEPEWMTNWRLDAFKIWNEMDEPDWGNVNYEKPDFQKISYYSAVKKKKLDRSKFLTKNLE